MPRPALPSNDETVDPVASSDFGANDADDVAFVEIAFHSDLRRIGARVLLGSREAPQTRSVVIGRDEPTFCDEDDTDVLDGPLADPCVSRRQLEIQWLPDEDGFTARPARSARRDVTLHDPTGAKLPWPADGRFPRGHYLAIGDRVLLRLDRGPLSSSPAFGLVGRGRAIHEVRRSILALTATRRTPGAAPFSVLIVGATGTGKELVARALHAAMTDGHRAPFVPLNCAALPDTLAEAELFGYERGAFSDAQAAREGIFRAAGRGTVFLDEIGELSPSTQAKLLRALEERRVRPIGSANEVAFEAMVIMATHRDLAAEVEAGTFRSDLYARIEAPVIALSPLRDRREDVPRLFVHRLASHVGRVERASRSPFRPADAHPPRIGMGAFLAMLRHDWPRNVRELDKVAAKVAIGLRAGGSVDQTLIPSDPSRSAQTAPTRERARDQAPSPDELLALLEDHDFVQSRLAATLRVSRTTLDKWMRNAGVRRPSDVSAEEIETELSAHRGDVLEAARRLRISSRGLRLRARELGLPAFRTR